LLAERWPACFAVRETKRRPLKVGIHEEIYSELAGVVTLAELSTALGAYVANPAYLKKCWRVGRARIGLPAGLLRLHRHRRMPSRRRERREQLARHPRVF
jgi:sRNA-binding protein